jgi:hypothetical protein
MSITPSLYAKARSEIIALFHWNADSLSPDQTLRLDCAVSLRLCLDHLQGCIIRGESIDVSRMLTASEALARLLPPAVLATPPAEQRDDHDAIAPLLKLFRNLHGDVHRLSAENAQLKARLGEGGAFPSVPLDVSTEDTSVDLKTAITPTDVVPPNEIGHAIVGKVAGPDDPRPGPLIEAKAVRRPNPPAAGAPAKPEPWQAWLDAGGNSGPGFDRWSNCNE